MGDNVIDVHIHFGAPCDPASGCYWSKKFESGLAYFAMLAITGYLFRKVTTERVKKHLFGVINGARLVRKGVLLALDEVYDKDGTCRRDLTNLHVPNRYLAQMAAENERVLFGASVHPFRPDWRKELDFCLENKAVLCKWLPSAQGIDPSDPLCYPFYEKIAAAGLPLLCHAGPEASIPPADDLFKQFNNPLFLRPAIERGVKVIIAHCALPLLPPPLENDQDYRNLLDLIRMDEAAGRRSVFADLSALLLGTREHYIGHVVADIKPERLVFGSDYPIPILGISRPKGAVLAQRLKYRLKSIVSKNPLDKSFSELAKAFDPSVFTNAANILRLG